MNSRSRYNSSSLPRLSAQEPSTAATPNNPVVTPNPPPSARSDVKAASVLATKTEYFEPWAKAVKLDTIILEMPDEGFGELLALVQVTKSLPRWITDENSAQQKSLQPDFADEPVVLSQYVSDLTPSEAWNEGPGDMISGGDNQASDASRSSGNTDSGINNDSSISLHDEPDSALDRALVFIFAIAQRTSQLTHHRIPPNEAELRTAVDSLLMFLFHKKGSISYR
ncbi:hypothetical protein BDV93DRAFT_610577 [Ceratobasidium sp. AG-I]|nr:hypothetical protein BDV93DRAFT_610577 [Ceratobasidium sp. AG-I]